MRTSMLLVSTLASAFLFACAPEARDPVTVAAREPDEKPMTAEARKIRIVEGEDVGCATEVLGLVDVHEPVKTVDQAMDELRKDAAELGAEAVIGVEFHHGEAGEEPTHLSGMAVRCNDLVKGRKYDVLADVTGTDKMGNENAAEHAMMAKATSLGADLVVDIHFEHGEGGDEPLRVWGKAVRFKR